MALSTNNIDELRKLYIKLQDEYNEYKSESDDICKEYESTIQILIESLDSLKIQNANLIKENKVCGEKIKELSEELKNVRIKNKDKMNDIELLNKQMDKLQSQYSEIKENKTMLKNKMVNLENDNEKYIEKIREYEYQIEDLKGKLENSMEDLITLQTEYEEYKNKSEENIQRFKEKLEDEKNNNNVLKKNNIKYNEKKVEENEEINNDEIKPKCRMNRAHSLIIKNNFEHIIKNMRKRKEEIIKFKQNLQKEITQFLF